MATLRDKSIAHNQIIDILSNFDLSDAGEIMMNVADSFERCVSSLQKEIDVDFKPEDIDPDELANFVKEFLEKLNNN